jgi:hypothetical protein
MLPLPLARMPADEHERRRLAEPLNGTRVRADQETGRNAALAILRESSASDVPR